MHPLIKWTGGKYQEFKFFKDCIPPYFSNYIEPFVGGGGVFFNLEPKCKSFLNDKSSDLMLFYTMLTNEKFKTEILSYQNDWKLIGAFSDQIFPELLILYNTFKENNSEDINKEISVIFDNNSDVFCSKFKFALIKNKEFIEVTKKSILNKFSRIKKIELKESKVFTPEEMNEHIETSLKGGFYTFFRNLFNLWSKDNTIVSDERKVANWFFIREMCYGSMFRFNEDGDFNIPYGGIGYNKKDLNDKITKMFSKECSKIFSNVELYNLDFEDFLNKIKFKDTDFIFLDPPYDSIFSEYDKNPFGQSDHQRLATYLLTLNCNWMLVIKNTDFIYKLYDHHGIDIKSFDKKYLYNARGRNDRNVEHLIIRNYT